MKTVKRIECLNIATPLLWSAAGLGFCSVICRLVNIVELINDYNQLAPISEPLNYFDVISDAQPNVQPAVETIVLQFVLLAVMCAMTVIFLLSVLKKESRVCSTVMGIGLIAAGIVSFAEFASYLFAVSIIHSIIILLLSLIFAMAAILLLRKAAISKIGYILFGFAVLLAICEANIFSTVIFPFTIMETLSIYLGVIGILLCFKAQV